MSDLLEAAKLKLGDEGEEVEDVSGGLPEWAQPKGGEAERPTPDMPWEAPLADEQKRRLQNMSDPEEATATVRLNQFFRHFGVLPKAVNTVKDTIKRNLEVTDDRSLLEKAKLDWKTAKDLGRVNNIWQTKLLMRRMSPEHTAQLDDELEKLYSGIDSRARERNFLGQLGFAAMNQIPMYWEAGKKGVPAAATLAILMGGVGAAAGGIGAFPAAAKGAAMGMQIGVSEEMMEWMGASMYENLSRNPDFANMPDDWKKSAAMTYGVAAGLVETMQMRALLKPTSKVLNMRFAKVLGKAATNAMGPSGALGTWLKLSGTEVGEEALQKGLELAIKDISGRLWNEFHDDMKVKRQEFNEMVREFGQEMKIAGPLAVLFSGVLGVAPSQVIQMGIDGKLENKTDDFIKGNIEVTQTAEQQANEYYERLERGDPSIDTSMPEPTFQQLQEMEGESGVAIDPEDIGVTERLAQPEVDRVVPMSERIGTATAGELDIMSRVAEERITKENKKEFDLDTQRMKRSIDGIPATHQNLTETDIGWLKRVKEWMGENFLHPARFLDSIEGGKGFRGFIKNLYWDEYNSLDVQEHEMKEIMVAETDKLYDGLQVDGKKLNNVRMQLDTKNVMIDGKQHKMRLDELGDLWASQFDKDKRAAMIHGLFQGDDINYREALSTVPEGVRTLTERTIEWYDSWYDQLNNMYRRTFGEDLDKIAGYTPIWRNGYIAAGFDADILNESKYRNVVRQTPSEPSFTQERVEHIDPDTQERLFPKLGLMHTQSQMMQKMSHFLAKADYLNKVQGIYNKTRNALQRKVGPARTAWLGEHINTLKHPEIAYGVGAQESFFRRMRQNATLGILSANINVIMKQGPSIAMYTVEGLDFVLRNSAKAFLPGGLKKMTNFAMSNSNVLPPMQMDPVFQEVAMGNYKRLGNTIHKMGNIGTWMLREIDRTVKVIGWNAVYDRYMAQTGIHELAVDQADRVTALTQPTARHQDIANIYKKGELSRTLMMFSKQLLNYTGTVFYDVPMYMKEKMVGRAVGYATALSTAMVSVWMIANKRIPSTKEDMKDIALSFGGLIPIMNRVIGAVGRPFSGAEIPILDIPADVVNSLLTDGWSENAEKKILGILSGATLLGVPTGFIKKSFKASKSILEGEWGDAFAKMIGEKDWDTMAEQFYGADEKAKKPTASELMRR